MPKTVVVDLAAPVESGRLAYTVDELAAYAGVERDQVESFLEIFSVGFGEFRDLGTSYGTPF